jgi:hypothetical protein
MANLLELWTIIGLIVCCVKIRQSRQFGFHQKVTVATLWFFVIGVAA